MDHVENTVSKSTSNVACIFVAEGMCLLSRYLETAVHLLISRLLHGNGRTRYSILDLGTRWE
jgi:hypothetical protein